MSRSAWVREAACAGLPVVETEAMFFGSYWPDRLAGLQLCNACPVRQACLDTADAVEGTANKSDMAGTWGGLTVNQRVERRKATR